jgi:hypothetical protein
MNLIFKKFFTSLDKKLLFKDIENIKIDYYVLNNNLLKNSI